MSESAAFRAAAGLPVSVEHAVIRHTVRRLSGNQAQGSAAGSLTIGTLAAASRACSAGTSRTWIQIITDRPALAHAAGRVEHHGPGARRGHARVVS